MRQRVDISAEEGTANPANAIGVDTVPMSDRKRVSMAYPKLRLQILEGSCPGYHLHWFRGSQDRISAALNGGYEFVTPEEVHLNNMSFSGDVTQSGNTDLGDRVSVSAGDYDDDKQGSRLYLMKIKEEWWKEDQDILGERQLQIADTITGGRIKGEGSGENAKDLGLRYIDKRAATKPIPDLFKPKHV